jgi:putative photosynthetic complex assembly protein
MWIRQKIEGLVAMTSMHPHTERAAMTRPIRRVDDRLMGLIMLGLLFVVAAVSLARSTNHVDAIPKPIGAPTLTRSLTFMDGSEGEVKVFDAGTGYQITTFEKGEGSFVRGAIRTFARVRQLQGVQLQAPVELAQYQDQRLVLSDPTTGQVIELSAFGATNASEFGKLLLSSSPALDSGVFRE